MSAGEETEDAFEPLLISELLGGVPEQLLRSLSPPPTIVHLRAGETLIRQGEPGQAFYLLVQGRLRVFVSDEQGISRRVNEVIPGEGVGEMSLLTGDVTSATLRAMHDSVLVRFSSESYLKLMEESPKAALQVMRTVIRRLQAEMSETHRQPVYRILAFLPLQPNQDFRGLLTELSTEIGRRHPNRLFSREDLPARWRESVSGRVRISASEERALFNWLAEQRTNDGMVLLLADFEPTEWTRLCMRQSHLVLLLATLGCPVELTEAETSLLLRIDPAIAPRTDLILLHPGEHQVDCKTRLWLTPRQIAEWHHLRTGQQSDLARLARILTGSAVNLVLGGGGARGLAQIGVLRALEEVGIPIDRVCGTSMGSMVGAMCAQRFSPDQMTEINRDLWKRQRLLSDYTFPAIAVLRGRKLHNAVRRIIGDTRIEDLPLSYFCVSGNLTEAELVVHDRGLLWEAVRASGSLPGAGPPMFLDGKILVDGGVLNNLPGDIMHSRHSGKIILVDVSRERQVHVPTDIEATPSGWRILLDRILPFRKPLPVPNIFEILYRTATLGSVRSSKSTYKLADFLLIPPVEDYSILSVHAMDEIIELGYRDAQARLREPGHSFSSYVPSHAQPEGSS